jgi:ubiquinone/menaquinone biosynthesis C-methylase UbiE
MAGEGVSMARIRPFEEHSERYESWFVRHDIAYRSEKMALARLMPDPGFALEIGVGTARFAEPLGIQIGLDPSFAMLRLARGRGIAAVCGIAEALPFRPAVFSTVLIVTTICFVDNARAMLEETRRVLKPGGAVVIGFIDRESSLGRHYLAHQHENVFYREATFFSARDVDALLESTGFGARDWRQTLFGPLDKMDAVEPPMPGFGEGAFVAVRAELQGADAARREDST